MTTNIYNHDLQDALHVRAGRPDGDQDGAARRRLHGLRPLPGQGAVDQIWVLEFELLPPDARKLQEHLRRGLSRDTCW